MQKIDQEFHGKLLSFKEEANNVQQPGLEEAFRKSCKTMTAPVFYALPSLGGIPRWESTNTLGYKQKINYIVVA